MFLTIIFCALIGASTARFLSLQDYYEAQRYAYGNGHVNFNSYNNHHVYPTHTPMRSDSWSDVYGSGAPEYRGGYNQRGYTAPATNSNNNHGNYNNNNQENNYGGSDYNNEYTGSDSLGSEDYREYKGAVYSGGGYSRIPTLVSISPEMNTNYGQANNNNNQGYNGYGSSDFNNQDNYFGGYNDDYRGGGYRESSYSVGNYNDYGYGNNDNNDGYASGSTYDNYDGYSNSDNSAYRGGGFSGRRRK